MRLINESKIDVVEVLRQNEVFPEEILAEIDTEEFRAVSRIIDYRKSELLLRTGDDVHYVYFPVDGVIRGYFLKPNGQEVTESLIYEKGMPLIPSSDLDAPSPLNYQVLVDSKILRVSLDLVRNLVENSMTVMRYTLHTFNIALREQRRLKGARFLYPSRERYEWFLEEYQDLVGRISNRVIASFIGVTPETLSRIQNTKPEDDK